MFSRLFNSTRHLLSRSNSPSQPLENETPASQAQSELQDAVDKMVTTRRQQHESNSSTLVDGLDSNSPLPGSKRKASHEPGESASSAHEQKRRYSAKERFAEQDAQDLAEGSSQLAEVLDSQDKDEDQKLVLRPHEGAPLDQEQLDLQKKDSVPDNSAAVATPSEPLQDINLDASMTEAPITREGRSLVPVVYVGDSVINQNSKHKRFGSEDSVALETQLNEHISNSGPKESAEDGFHENNEEGSDDEAPETVTVTTGQDQARSAVVEAEKAAKRQVNAEKERRRKRDAELKSQAKAAKEERKKREKASAASKHKQSAESLAEQLLKAEHLPDELPEELLVDDSDAESRIPTPPPEITTKQVVKNKRKFLDVDSKPPKDIHAGSTVVRVLQNSSTVLPPQVSKSSMAVREAWLIGNRGKGSNVEKRKPFRKGFLRK